MIATVIPTVVACWLSSVSCQAPSELPPTRTISDCMIAIERLDHQLRVSGMRIINANCTATEPERTH